MLPWLLCALVALLAAGLLIRLLSLKRGLDRIAAQLADRLSGDTNNPIFLSCRDRDLRRLAAALNRQLATLRRQRQRYLLGDRELKEAIANVSHDLRTPLAAIWGYLELLKDEPLSPAGRRYLSLLLDRAAALRQLTEEVLRYSVAVSPRELPPPQPVCLNHLLEECLAQFYPALTRRGIAPQIVIPEKEVWRQLPRDSAFRVVENLLSNALKYSDGDLSVTLSPEGEIALSNRAAGLDPVQVGRLFDRFYSVESARPAAGLGLSIAKSLTEQMGGRLEAGYQDGRLTLRLWL